MRKLKAVVVTAILSWVGSVTSAQGSGFGIFTQGASALGQANSVVAHEEGPSTLFFNPALMNRLRGTQVEAGTTLIFPHRKFQEPGGTATTTRDTVFFPSTFYVTHAFNDNISAGLAVFNPFGLSTDWGGEWQGRYLATKSEITTYNINPALSYRVLPNLSVAAGLDVVVLDATLQSKVPSTALGIAGPAFDVNQRFTGSGEGVGYNVALAWAVTDSLSLGASYRSKVRIGIDGDLSFDAVPGKTAGDASLTLPQQVFTGIAYRVSEDFTTEAGMRWEDWSSFRQLEINLAGLPPAVYPRNWHSTFAVNGGGKYRLNDRYAISAGYLYGWNPVPNETFEPAIPDSNTHLFCLGGEAQIDRLKISLGYGYQLQENRTKATNVYGPTANGEYSADLHLVGISVGWYF